jgi:hypothetical protein
MVCDVTENGTIDKKTNTNIKSTCVYGSDEDVLMNDNVWSKKRCIETCGLKKDE